MKQKSGIKQQNENTFNQHAHSIHQMIHHIHNACTEVLFWMRTIIPPIASIPISKAMRRVQPVKHD